MKTCMTSHSQPKIFTEDLLVRDALLRHDGKVTRMFFYQQCYPLFKSIFDNYYTDCACVKEFIDEIYLIILTPNQGSGRCQLENYRGESSLATWIKTVCLFHCYHRHNRKSRIPTVEIKNSDDDDEGFCDRLLSNSYSTTMDMSSIDRNDLEVILSMMPNKRYRDLIRLRYIERKTNEETAEALQMSMANYYNKHKLAKAQFISKLKKESE